MNALDLQIARERTFFAISTRPAGTGPFLASVSHDPVRHVRDAQLFNAADADAVLRAHPRYSVLQAIQVGNDDSADD